jgi:hypothetical protein
MNEISKQVIENVFPEERNRFIAWVKAQKRNLRAWLTALLVLSLVYTGTNFVIVQIVDDTGNNDGGVSPRIAAAQVAVK